MGFQDFGFNKQLLNAVEEAGYTEATPIQQKAIPAVLSGQDVFGIAPTGTGKTAAYLLPLLMRLHYAQGNDMRALILAPTRELALQLHEVAVALAKYTDLRILLAYGGVGMKAQKEAIEKGLDLLVCTPGRFMDLYLSNALVTKKLQVMVMDEADKMMDMGFMPAINRILEVIPRKRQNLLFSATMSPRVQQLSTNFVEHPTVVEVAPQATTAVTVEQQLYYVPNIRSKINLLLHIMDAQEEVSRLIIFCKTRLHAENIYSFLDRKFGSGSVRVIHANKGQNSRINAMNEFKEGNIRVLVATDVAARGIDITDVSHVLNFDVPLIYEDYVHRIGRTGRANKTGVAITFCNEAEVYHIKKIQKLIRQQIPVLDIPTTVEVVPTTKEERQTMMKEIDVQKRREDPEFKGAFHEKKFQKTNKKPAKKAADRSDSKKKGSRKK